MCLNMQDGGTTWNVFLDCVYSFDLGSRDSSDRDIGCVPSEAPTFYVSIPL